MRKVHLAVTAAVALLASPALARTPVPIVDWSHQPVATGSGNKLSTEQVVQAVMKAAAAESWAVAKVAEGKYVGTRVVRGKHTIVVTIAVSPEEYSVSYQSSINMKHDVWNGVPVIHPNYNVWTRQLVDAVRLELSRL